MARGEHIRVRRPWYWHHGIDMGDGTVVHLPAAPGDGGDARVVHTSVEEFARGGEMEALYHVDALSPEEVVARAASRVGRRGYHVIRNNCEHFAIWCVTGTYRSRQVEQLARGGMMAGMVMRAGAGWLARRSGSRVVVLIPVLRPLASGVMAASALLSVLSRARQDGSPVFPPSPPRACRWTPGSRTPPG